MTWQKILKAQFLPIWDRRIDGNMSMHEACDKLPEILQPLKTPEMEKTLTKMMRAK